MMNKSVNKEFVKSICFVVLWVVVIFSFSMQSGDESSELSGGIVAWIVELLFGGEFRYAEQLEFFIRKLAHFTEYFILGVLVLQTVKQTRCSESVVLSVFASMLVCVLVASCDETIQLFSGGRCGQVVDVVLDSCGALCGVVGSRILIRCFKRG